MLMVSVLVCLIAIPSHRHQNAARTVAAVHAEHAQQVKHVLRANAFVLKGRDVPVKRAGLMPAEMRMVAALVRVTKAVIFLLISALTARLNVTE